MRLPCRYVIMAIVQMVLFAGDQIRLVKYFRPHVAVILAFLIESGCLQQKHGAASWCMGHFFDNSQPHVICLAGFGHQHQFFGLFNHQWRPKFHSLRFTSYPTLSYNSIFETPFPVGTPRSPQFRLRLFYHSRSI